MPVKDQETNQGTEEGILRAIRTLGNGSVEVIVQDSKVIQVKVQFSKARLTRSKDPEVSVPQESHPAVGLDHHSSQHVLAGSGRSSVRISNQRADRTTGSPHVRR